MMNRKNFIKTCGFTCLSGAAIITLITGCGSLKPIKGDIKDADLIIPLSHFKLQQGAYKSHLIVQHDMLQYPICIYRFSATEYSALWLRCTHQGAELQVFGDKLQCPAHGSEFNSKGQVQNGPASSALRTFPVTIDGLNLKISLKAV